MPEEYLKERDKLEREYRKKGLSDKSALKRAKRQAAINYWFRHHKSVRESD